MEKRALTLKTYSMLGTWLLLFLAATAQDAASEVYRCGSTFSTTPCGEGTEQLSNVKKPRRSEFIGDEPKSERKTPKAKVLTESDAESEQKSRTDVIRAPDAVQCVIKQGAPVVNIFQSRVRRKDLGEDALLTFVVSIKNKSNQSISSPISLLLLSPDGERRRYPISPKLSAGEAITEEFTISVNRSSQAELLAGEYTLQLHYAPAGSCDKIVVDAGDAELIAEDQVSSNVLKPSPNPSTSLPMSE